MKIEHCPDADDDEGDSSEISPHLDCRVNLPSKSNGVSRHHTTQAGGMRTVRVRLAGIPVQKPSERRQTLWLESGRAVPQDP